MRRKEGKRERAARARENGKGGRQGGKQREREKEPEKKLWVPVRGRTQPANRVTRRKYDSLRSSCHWRSARQRRFTRRRRTFRRQRATRGSIRVRMRRPRRVNAPGCRSALENATLRRANSRSRRAVAGSARDPIKQTPPTPRERTRPPALLANGLRWKEG